jgi:hypothetical protein
MVVRGTERVARWLHRDFACPQRAKSSFPVSFGVRRLWRGRCRTLVATGASSPGTRLPSSPAHLLVHRERREAPSYLSPPSRWPNLPLVSSHQNPSRHCQFSPDPGRFRPRPPPLASSASSSCSLVADMWSAATTDAIFFPAWPPKH